MNNTTQQQHAAIASAANTAALLKAAQGKLEAAMTKKPVISAEVIEGELVIEFDNDKVITLNPARLTDEIRAAALLHGLKQKLVDAAAIARDTDTGRSATTEDKYQAVLEVYERITAAEGASWNKVREAGTGGGAGSGVLLRALMQLTGKDKAAIEAFLEEKTKEEKSALRSNPKVAAIIAELQRAKVSDVDTDSLLDELGA